MAVGFTIVYFAGRVLRHIGGILLLCWRRMLWAALITGGVGLVVAEIGGSSVTKQIPAPLPAQIVALLFAIGLGYGAALTALLAEMLIGALETIQMLEGDAEAGARATAVIGERVGGELSGFVGWVDARAVAVMTMLKGRGAGRSASTHPASARQSAEKQRLSSAASQAAKPNRPQKGARAPAALAQRPPLEFQRGAASGRAYTQAAQPEAQVEVVTLNLETLADIAATEEFINTSPRPKVNARPVAANQLPRIEWAFDKQERGQQNTADAPAPAPPVAPLEWQAPPAAAAEYQPHGISPHSVSLAETSPATSEMARPFSPSARPADISPISSEAPAASAAPIEQREAEGDMLPKPPDSSGA